MCRFVKHFSCVFAFCIATVSCENTMDIPVVDVGGRLYVECFPSNMSDTTFVSVCATSPVADMLHSAELEDVTVEMAVNGIAVMLKPLYKKKGKAVFYTTCLFDAGDEVSVDVAAGGYPPVSSCTCIPEGPRFECVRELYKGFIRHRFSFDSNVGDKRYYGVKIHGVIHYHKVISGVCAPEHTVEEEYMDVPIMATSNVTALGDDLVEVKTIVQVPVNGGTMVVFEDGASMENFEVILDVPFVSDREEFSMMEPMMTETRLRKCMYKIEVFSISPDAYRFLNPRINYSLLGAGLVSPFVCHGNVSGGYGFVSGMGKSDTGWIENMEPVSLSLPACEE